MHLSGEEILIDLETINLFGWEPVKKKSKVQKLVTVLEQGGSLPAVPVIQEPDGFYLVPGFEDDDTGLSDGGHKRALAHLQLGRRLPVVVHYNSGIPYTRDKQVNIRDIQIIDE